MRFSTESSWALLKNGVLWDGSPPGSAGVPNLFGLSPPGRQFVAEKTPNKLGTPTGDAFFNRIHLTEAPSGSVGRPSPIKDLRPSKVASPPELGGTEGGIVPAGHEQQS